jgi:hypothetical protein
MAIVRMREVAIADAWGNDEGGVTLEVRGKKARVSIDEAEEHAFAILTAANDQRQTIRDREMPAPDTNEPAF